MTHPALKSFFLPAALFALAGPQLAAAQTSEPSVPLSALYACEALSSKEAQLACFLKETSKLRAAETAGEIIAVEKETFAEIKEAEIEKQVEQKVEERVKAKTEVPKKREVAIRSAAPGTKGYMRFTLENGEVWQQTEAAKVKLGKGAPDVLMIKKASFGSFIGRVNDKRPSFRMKQVK